MEVLVSRMKAFSDDIRFVAVSATIPNAVDVSTWIGKRENGPQIISGPGVGEIDESSQLYTFSENFRPCPLKKVRNDPDVCADSLHLTLLIFSNSSSMAIAIQAKINGPLIESSTIGEISAPHLVR